MLLRRLLSSSTNFGWAVLFLLTLPLLSPAQTAPAKQDWLQLFNGKDLTGWDVKIAGYPLNDNVGNTFRVEDGMLRIAYDQYDRFDKKYGHLYYKQPFSHYILKFEYRFTGNQVPGGDAWNVRNSGVMIHSQSAQSVGLKQDFPISLEVQVLGGLDKGERYTANLCTPGTQVFMDGKLNTAHCIDSKSKTYNGDQWVAVEVVVLGDSIRHLIDGETVLAYQKAQIGGGYVSKQYDFKQANVPDPQAWAAKDGTPLTTGYIALQSESHPIDFRNIELLNLKGCMDSRATNYKSYYTVSDKSQCVYKR
ncbi:3-keto-disaccharide hydrolase [Spirosoma arcticum]